MCGTEQRASMWVASCNLHCEAATNLLLFFPLAICQSVQTTGYALSVAAEPLYIPICTKEMHASSFLFDRLTNPHADTKDLA